MIELQVVEVDREHRTTGRGKLVFVYPPRIGEVIMIPDVTPSLNFYEVMKVEHVPTLPDGVRAASARPYPTATLTVRWAYDWDVFDD